MRPVHRGYALLLSSPAVWLALVACNGDADNSASTAEPTLDAGGEQQASETVLPEEPLQVGGDPPREDDIDPCSTVTRVEVEELLDGPVTDLYRHSKTVVCEYFSEVGASFGSVTIRLATTVSQAVLDDEVRAAEELGASQAEAVPGLGNAAYSVGPLLFVYEKDTLLVIAVIVSNAVELAGAKDAASKVLPRLP